MAKGVGAILYLDFNSDNTYQDAGCIYGLKPPGYSRGIEDGEACLGDTVKTQDTGDIIRTPLDGSLQSDPDTAGTDIEGEIETAMKADTSVQWCIKHPIATPVYQYGTGKFSEFDYDGFERDTQMKRPIQLLPDADPTYSATPPTVGGT
jgi:hypothetical protein